MAIKLGETIIQDILLGEEQILKVYCGEDIVWEKELLPSEYREIAGLTMNNNCYYNIEGFTLTGADTVRFSMTTIRTDCNVFGRMNTKDANNNYSLYLTSIYNREYLRYNGGTYNSFARSNKTYDVVIGPTGTQGLETNSTWEEKEFECLEDLFIGAISEGSTTDKFRGTFNGHFVVDGRLDLIPCERISDGVIGYYDRYSKIFYEPIGTNPTPVEYV